MSAAVGYVDAGQLRGLSVAGFHLLDGSIGLTIGIVNWTDELHGIQVGLLNRAGNNPAPFNTLPFVNAHF